MKKKTKPTSVRLDEELLKELDQRCSKAGCSRNDFIKNSVDFIINGASEFDFGDEEVIESASTQKEEPKITIKDMEHGRVYDDKGNLIATFDV